jgi:succinoglycan biosynthesis protein ExoO
MITVLIAAFNAGRFIERAIQSAVAQGSVVSEILIVDDASSDDTALVVRELSRLDARIRLIELSTNGGPSKARNVGIEAAKGQWIAILDADDAMLPGRLDHMLSVADALCADVVVDNFYPWSPPTRSSPEAIGLPGIKESGQPEFISTERYLLNARPYSPEADWGLLKPMFRKRFLHERQLSYPTSIRHGEDFHFIVEILLCGGRYVVTRKPGYLFTQRSSGRSRTIVNYDLMLENTVLLLKDSRVLVQRPLVEAIRARASAVRRLIDERRLLDDLDAKKIARVVRHIASRPDASRTVAMALLRKAKAWTRQA